MDSKEDKKNSGPLYSGDEPTPKQWEIPIPGGKGKLFDQKDVMKNVHFYSKTAVVILMFIFSAVVISAIQIASLPFALFNRELFDKIIHYTQELFGVSMVGFHQLFAPTSFILYKDPSIENALYAPLPSDPSSIDSPEDYKVRLNLPERLVLISNHQLYSDWINIWCFSYFARRHGDMKIILKKSLKRIPGMWFFDFIFLERNWSRDEKNFMAHMAKLNASTKPLWLLLFPEGTTLTGGTRQKSKEFAEKNGIEPYNHLLVPRSLGIFKCVNSLRESVDYVYDLTIGIPGVEAGGSPQYIYTLALMYVIGLNPSQIHIHVRRFKLSEIPEDEDEFGTWLRLRWREKDELLDHFYKHGCFAADVEHPPSVLNVSLRHFFEIFQIPMLLLPWFILGWAYTLIFYFRS